MIGQLLLSFSMLAFAVLFYKILVVDHDKIMKGSSGKCEDCGHMSNILYQGSGRKLCQFCDDKSIERGE